MRKLIPFITTRTKNGGTRSSLAGDFHSAAAAKKKRASNFWVAGSLKKEEEKQMANGKWLCKWDNDKWGALVLGQPKGHAEGVLRLQLALGLGCWWLNGRARKKKGA